MYIAPAHTGDLGIRFQGAKLSLHCHGLANTKWVTFCICECDNSHIWARYHIYHYEECVKNILHPNTGLLLYNQIVMFAKIIHNFEKYKDKGVLVRGKIYTQY